MVGSGKGYADVVRLLLAAGAEVNTANKNGETALAYAFEFGHTEVVQLLKAAGARH
jgi:ankyrin repeat protein